MSIFIFGEAMLEYHCRSSGGGLRFGGDTLNTAIHLARLGKRVAYVTALGTDKISDALISRWGEEGIDTRFVLRHPQRQPGIYATHVDECGEREFIYWRDQSAARDMFSLSPMRAALGAAADADLLYFSNITLAILPEDGRERLIQLARHIRACGRAVAYDSNFRSILWPTLAAAQRVSRAAMEVATIGLPTNVDEWAMWDVVETEAHLAQRWRSAGCSEVVVKAGEKGCLASVEGEADLHLPAHRVNVVDTSGAGDAFNAAYLSARLDGEPVRSSLAAGHRLAAWVIQQTGAVPAREAG